MEEAPDLIKWILGACSAVGTVVVSYILYKDKSHATERKEQRDQHEAERKTRDQTNEKQYDTLVDISKDTNKALSENTGAIKEMTGVLGQVRKQE